MRKETTKITKINHEETLYDIIDINDIMATLLIRNLDESLKKALRKRAAEHGRSMEEEARLILGLELRRDRSIPREGLGTRLHRIFMEVGGVELELPARDEMVEDPHLFDEEDS